MTDGGWGKPAWDREEKSSLQERCRWTAQAVISSCLMMFLVFLPIMLIFGSGGSGQRWSTGLGAPFVIIPVALALATKGGILIFYFALAVWWIIALSGWLLSRRGT